MGVAEGGVSERARRQTAEGSAVNVCEMICNAGRRLFERTDCGHRRKMGCRQARQGRQARTRTLRT
jgi:hypothetical protein